jgi:hypothetical protein
LSPSIVSLSESDLLPALSFGVCWYVERQSAALTFRSLPHIGLSFSLRLNQPSLTAFLAAFDFGSRDLAGVYERADAVMGSSITIHTKTQGSAI